MELLLLLKLAHVVGAIIWVGGASVLTLMCLMLDRKGDDQATLTGISQVAMMGNRVFAPIGLAVIVSGLLLAWLAGYGFQAWTILATVIVAGTFTLGAAVLGPTCERCVKTWAETGDTATAIGIGRRVLALVKLDLAAQFAIISLMVLKPGWVDTLMIVPAAFLALGGALYAMNGSSRTTAAQPA
jgi:uncharacterized membrane protein